MRLKVLLPTQVLIDEDVVKIVAQAQNGSFCLLPHHIDFVSALVPGVLLYVDTGGSERFLGIADGILVKCAEEVLVSAPSAVPSDDLETLQQEIQSRFIELDDRERSARSALARLEAGVVRRFVELRDHL